MGRLSATIFLFTTLFGCAVPAPKVLDDHDPFEHFNRSVFEFNDRLDKAVLKPVAKGYDAILPGPVNRAVTNFFNNIGDIWVVVNDLLQGKPKQAVEDASRVAYNTTFGLLGLVDVATHMDLPKHREDFGQTLGVWGLEAGPYLVLPLFGPSSVRDGVGLAADSFANPVRYVDPPRDRWLLTALRTVDVRADLLPAERVVDEAALDPYLFLRESYLQSRVNLVYDGNPPEPEFDDDFFDDDFFEDSESDDAVESPQ